MTDSQKQDKYDLTINNPVCQSIYQTLSTIDEQIVANNEEEIFKNADLILRTKDNNIMQFKIEYDEILPDHDIIIPSYTHFINAT